MISIENIMSQTLKRIALRGNHRKPLVRIEKAELTHRIHIPESYCDS